MKKLVAIFAALLLAIIFSSTTVVLKRLESPPKFCTHDFTELSKIAYISKFRSIAGHDYSDSFEHDCSMKHYYCPREVYGNSDSSIKIFSPADGWVSYIVDEGHVLSNGEIQGKQVGIRVKRHPDFEIILFHINPRENLSDGDYVKAGEFIGYADTRDNSCFDIAIRRDLIIAEKLYSYFQVMDDNIFNEYRKHGIESRSQMIIPKDIADRNLSPDEREWKTRHDEEWKQLE